MLKFISAMEYARLKDKERVADRLQKDMWVDLSFEQEAELLLRIGKGTQLNGCRSEDAAAIKAIGFKWMNEICWAYNNKPYKED
jgi:hypothetical protein